MNDKGHRHNLQICFDLILSKYFFAFQSTSPISCASSSSETSEEEDGEEKIKRRKNLYELKKKLEIETPVDIPDIVDDIDIIQKEVCSSNNDANSIISGTSNKGMKLNIHFLT